MQVWLWIIKPQQFPPEHFTFEYAFSVSFAPALPVLKIVFSYNLRLERQIKSSDRAPLNTHYLEMFQRESNLEYVYLCQAKKVFDTSKRHISFVTNNIFYSDIHLECAF